MAAEVSKPSPGDTVSRPEHSPAGRVCVSNPRSFNAKRPKQVGKGFASRKLRPMRSCLTPQTTSIRRARLRWRPACPEADVVAALAGAGRAISSPHAEAVRSARALRSSRGRAPRPRPVARARSAVLRIFSDGAPSRRLAGVPLALSSTLHAGLVAVAVFIATFNLTPRAASLKLDDRPAEPMRLVFVATPGPGGGGGGGGLLQKAPPPKALREGHSALSSPMPERREPKPIGRFRRRPNRTPTPLLKAEPLPVVDRADHHGAGRHAQPRSACCSRRRPRTRATARATAAAPARARAPASAQATAAASGRARAAAPAADRIVPAAASSRRVCCAK